ncbi:MAG: YegS/Rv2252/BmrU family lipid kinase [Bacteroidota bacterium]|nr:YegS/Rv2252/BmrU family lipid kinase [Bacteroidota bacterium]
MSRNILFFINPISGAKSKSQLEKKIIKKCGERNIAFEILFTSKDGDYNFLKNKIEKDSITDIVICGGDGSLSPIISSILNTKINVGIIPLGSGNGLARTAHIPKSIDNALEIIFKGNASYVDAFLINNNLSCHVSGLGFDAKVAHEFSRQRSRGLSTYTKQAVKNFFSAKTYSFIIETNVGGFSTSAFLVCIANSNQFGNNFKIAPKASINDGLLDIVIVKKNNKFKIVFAFLSQILSGKISNTDEKDFHKKDILYFQAKNIIIKNPDHAPLHIDGDPAETNSEFSIEILPAAYKLIRPA